MRYLTMTMLAAPLAGCSLLSPGLAGDWEGDVDCDSAQGDDLSGVEIALVMELDKDSADTFSGQLDMVQLHPTSYQGSAAELLLTVACDIELGLEAATGEQDLDYDIEIDEYDCELYQNGSLVQWSCDAIGVSVDTEQSDFGVLAWDGKDSIDIDDGRCQGELER